MKSFYLNIILALSLFLVGCQKGDQTGETIILLGEETYIKPLDSFIPDSLQVKFKQQMGNVAEGYIPPNIEGIYVQEPKVLVHSNFNEFIHSHEMYLKVVDQHNRTATVEVYDGGGVITDTAYIMGHDQYFTLYFTELKAMPSSAAYPWILRDIIITGKKEEGGIRDMMYGTIIKQVPSSSSPWVVNFKPGHYYIYKDDDGFSENSDWPND